MPIPIMPKVKAELECMEHEGVISSNLDPTEQCAAMAPIITRARDIRICVDLKHLNESIVRAKFVYPTKEDIFHKSCNCPVFGSLDATTGFWQIPLDVYPTVWALLF